MTEQKAATSITKRTASKGAKPTATKKPAAKKTAAIAAAVAEPKKAKAPAEKKPAATATGAKAAAKKTPVGKAAAKVQPTFPEKATSRLTPEERYRMVETTAYYIAERHGFQGDSTEHWVAAELEVAAKLGQ